MDALKSAGRAIIKSPGIPRHTWGTSKHEKLPENWTDTKETLMEGMAFSVKYLGMTLVEQPKGEEMASAAIRRIVSTARASAKKFQKVTQSLSKGIILTDTETNELIDNVSIYRISYCTADKAQDKVFAYVAQSQFNETLECHAFLCPKKKIAQAVTLTVAQAFKVALDLWETAQEGAEKTNGGSNEEQLRKPFFSSSIHQSTSQHNTRTDGHLSNKIHGMWMMDLMMPFPAMWMVPTQPQTGRVPDQNSVLGCHLAQEHLHRTDRGSISINYQAQSQKTVVYLNRNWRVEWGKYEVKLTTGTLMTVICFLFPHSDRVLALP